MDFFISNDLCKLFICIFYAFLFNYKKYKRIFYIGVYNAIYRSIFIYFYNFFVYFLICNNLWDLIQIVWINKCMFIMYFSCFIKNLMLGFKGVVS